MHTLVFLLSETSDDTHKRKGTDAPLRLTVCLLSLPLYHFFSLSPTLSYERQSMKIAFRRGLNTHLTRPLSPPQRLVLMTLRHTVAALLDCDLGKLITYRTSDHRHCPFKGKLKVTQHVFFYAACEGSSQELEELPAAPQFCDSVSTAQVTLQYTILGDVCTSTTYL